MELGNNAIKIHRESIDFRRNEFPGGPVSNNVSTKCMHSYIALSQCVLQKKLNILDHQSTSACNQPLEDSVRSRNGVKNVPVLSAGSTKRKSTAAV